MSAPVVDPALAQSSLAEQQMRTMRRQAEASRRDLNGAPASDPAREKKLREACEGFEAVFIQKMWEGMRASLPKEGLLHSREEQFWQGMYDQELGKSLASAGGIGLADMMVSQLSRKLQSASEVAARRASRVPFDIAPAPLLPSRTQPARQPAAVNVYEGEAAQPEVAPPTELELSANEAAPVQETPVDGALREFASGMNNAAPSSVSTVHVYKAGQRPAQSLDELAASLAAQAASTNEGPVRVTTTRQVNGSSRARSGRAHATLRRPAGDGAGRGVTQPAGQIAEQSAPLTAQPTQLVAGHPGTNRQGTNLQGMNQPGAALSGRMTAATPGSQAEASADRTVQKPGPAAMNISVEGIGAGSELASNNMNTRNIPPAGHDETVLN